MEINVVATIALTFYTEDGLVSNEDDAVAEMLDYLATGPNPNEFDIDVEVMK